MDAKEIEHDRLLAEKAFGPLYTQMVTNCGIDASHKEFWKVIADKANSIALEEGE